MTLPDKQKEALPRLVGWEYKPICKDGPSFWQRIGSVNQIICPDMATPEGMVELLDRCWKCGLEMSIRCFPNRSTWIVTFRECLKEESLEYCDRYLPEAVCNAVDALYKGGYLTEKEIEK